MWKLTVIQSIGTPPLPGTPRKDILVQDFEQLLLFWQQGIQTLRPKIVQRTDGLFQFDLQNQPRTFEEREELVEQAWDDYFEWDDEHNLWSDLEEWMSATDLKYMVQSKEIGLRDTFQVTEILQRVQQLPEQVQMRISAGTPFSEEVKDSLFDTLNDVKWLLHTCQAIALTEPSKRPTWIFRSLTD